MLKKILEAQIKRDISINYHINRKTEDVLHIENLQAIENVKFFIEFNSKSYQEIITT